MISLMAKKQSRYLTNLKRRERLYKRHEKQMKALLDGLLAEGAYEKWAELTMALAIKANKERLKKI